MYLETYHDLVKEVLGKLMFHWPGPNDLRQICTEQPSNYVTKLDVSLDYLQY